MSDWLYKESLFCVCGHHVQDHEIDMSLFVWNTFNGHCKFTSKYEGKRNGCSCQEFKPYQSKIRGEI